MVYITVLISGSGTNLQAIIDACESGIIPDSEVNGVISNQRDAYGLVRAKKHGIPTVFLPFQRKEMPRDVYETQILAAIRSFAHATDIVVLAGWMHILGKSFLTGLGIPIINLHPALPGEFPGKDAIGEAHKAFKEGRLPQKRTGVMVHYVIPEIDAGTMICATEVPIFDSDTEEVLRARVQYCEKPILIQSLLMIICSKTSIPDRKAASKWPCDPSNLLHQGKVRDMYQTESPNLIALMASNRFSSFDRIITEIPHKGAVLTALSAWWFKRTQGIMPNHMISARENLMIVRRCKPFPVEVVVRAYITGSTNTSIWTHYARGERSYCGIELPEGLNKHDKLPDTLGPAIITPTTKDTEHDEPLSAGEVVARGLATQEEWDYISTKALEVFAYGQSIVAERGLLLVDTKFEFGRDLETGKILLIDEVLTCDSSRFWKASTYMERVANGLEPERMDKDILREWLKERCDPYDTSQPLPGIPAELKARVEAAYLQFYQTLTGEPFRSANRQGMIEVNY